MIKKENKIPLVKLDDLFSTQEERDSDKLEKIIEVEISNIDDFKNHPFKVIENDELLQMRDSIRENGVLVPTLIRPKGNGRYEMISGHRRKKASQLAKKETIPCIIRELSDAEATIIMVDSNLQREKILPSEKAFAYKLKLEALKSQGKRNDLTSDQVGPKLERANERLSEQVGDSITQIKRYIRLTELIPEILEKVDNKIIAFNPAVEISYLKKDEQYMLLDWMEYNLVTPSHSQAIKLKKMSQEGVLKEEDINELLSQFKPNQISKIKFNEDKIRKVLPANIEDPKIEEFVIKAIEFYNRYLKKKELGDR